MQRSITVHQRPRRVFRLDAGVIGALAGGGLIFANGERRLRFTLGSVAK
jgi:hypothetical protein